MLLVSLTPFYFYFIVAFLFTNYKQKIAKVLFICLKKDLKSFAEIFFIFVANLESKISDVYDIFTNRHTRELCT